VLIIPLGDGSANLDEMPEMWLYCAAFLPVVHNAPNYRTYILRQWFENLIGEKTK